MLAVSVEAAFLMNFFWSLASPPSSAQSAERKALNLVVVGSSPSVGVVADNTAEGKWNAEEQRNKEISQFGRHPRSAGLSVAPYMSACLRGIESVGGLYSSHISFCTFCLMVVASGGC